MKLNEILHFCNCLLPGHREHETAALKDGSCAYCGYHTVKRAVTEADLRTDKKDGEKLRKMKKEYMELHIKKIKYKEEIQ